MNFNLDLIKQAQDVVLSCKTEEISYPLLVFSNASVSQSSLQKHVSVTLDTKLMFYEHPK